MKEVINVKRCARCEQDHQALPLKKFGRPIEDTDGTVWAWWATCPITGEPILVQEVIGVIENG